MEKKKILVVDDEAKIVDVVKSYLLKQNYEVFTAENGGEALNVFEKVKPHLLILDLMLPDISGEEVCKAIRKSSRVPIIMLTAKAEDDDIFAGLNIGADDYVTKPFSPKVLMARVAAILRRSEDEEGLANVLAFRDNELVIDLLKYEVLVRGIAVNLTPNEFNILKILLFNQKRVFTREEIINKTLGYDFDGFDRVIDTHIKNLRQKIEEDPKKPRYILTVHGVGYKFGGE